MEFPFIYVKYIYFNRMVYNAKHEEMIEINS